MIKGHLIRGLLLGLAAFAGANAWAFEESTHENISIVAFTQSTVGRGYLDEELLLDVRRLFTEGGTKSTLQQWLAQGSVREDILLRSGYHFYDPHFDRGLTITGFAGITGFVGITAPDWAFEQPTENPSLQLSWTDARRSFVQALTAQTPNAREAAMAQTFRMLGDVIHLIQDMGSPEHTRNDPHGGIRIPLTNLYPLGAESLFEKHINETRDSFIYTGYPPQNAPPLRFDTFRGFWKTGDGRGFAEFSNRGFITKRTNFEQLVQGSMGKGYTESGRSWRCDDDSQHGRTAVGKES